MDSETIEVYDSQVDKYVELTKSEAPDKSLRGFMARIPAGGTILDLGCGPGGSASAMKKAGFTVEAIDASAEMVRIAKELFSLDVRHGVFQDIREVNHYDGVWANFSLLHATEDEFVGLLPLLHRALKPQGILFLGLKAGEGTQRDRLGRRYTYYTEVKLSGLLAAANFSVVHTETGEGVGLAGDVAPFVLTTAQANEDGNG
ncbi:MAG: methyltransferase domain-containing protein [Gammaproteobacteria bacterium]|nr:methyltransferase domain-containing protein [Gammaproteobacteria bacterium]